MPNTIAVRNVNPWVKDEYKRRAHAEGKAFNEYMLEVLSDIAANPDADALEWKRHASPAVARQGAQRDPVNTRIAIRDVPDEVRCALEDRARSEGRTVGEYLERTLEVRGNVRPIDLWLGRVRKRVRGSGVSVPAEAIVAAVKDGRP